MSYEAGLGHFALLARELRDLIWQRLDPEDAPSLSIVSKAIEFESAPILRSVKIEFVIYGSSKPSAPSAICVQDQYKSYGFLHPGYQSFSSRDHEQLQRLLRFPYHRIRETVVRIEPPSEPGDLLRSWNSLIWLMDLWARAKPDQCHLRVAFGEGGGRTWSKNGVLNCSLLNKLRDPSAALHADVRLLLQPLRRVRDTVLSIDMPQSMAAEKHAALHRLSANIEAVARNSSPFGDIDSPDYEDEKVIAGQELACSAWYDYILDDMPGLSAARLRLERFAHWSAGYRANHAHQYRYASWEILRKFNIRDNVELELAFELRKRAAVAAAEDGSRNLEIELARMSPPPD